MESKNKFTTLKFSLIFVGVFIFVFYITSNIVLADYQCGILPSCDCEILDDCGGCFGTRTVGYCTDDGGYYTVIEYCTRASGSWESAYCQSGSTFIQDICDGTILSRYVYMCDYNCCDSIPGLGFAGCYHLSCSGKDGDGLPPGTPDFFVDIVEPSKTVEQGNSTTYNPINITPSNSYTGTVNLSQTGCPSGASCTLSPTSITFTNDSPNPGTSAMTISNTAGVAPGTYTLTVTGTDTAPEPDLIHSDNTELIVTRSRVAVCDNDWHAIPSTNGSANNVVGIFIPPTSASNFKNSIGVVVPWGIPTWPDWGWLTAAIQNCNFSQPGANPNINPCTWTGSWQSLGNLIHSWFGGTNAVFTSLLNNTWNIYAQIFYSDILGGPSQTVEKHWANGAWDDTVAELVTWNTPHTATDAQGRTWDIDIQWGSICSPSNFCPSYRCTSPQPPTCTSSAPAATETTATSGTFYVYAYGVQNATAVKFPTWGDPVGQDDLVWYPGENLGGGTWRAAINLGNHKAGNPEFGHFNVHVYMDNGGYTNQWCGTADFTRNPPSTSCGSGTGLRGRYYDGKNFETLVSQYTDPTINFDPADTLLGTNRANGPDTFSVSWEGQVEPCFSETYTFYTTTDDGVRLWVNNQLVIDKWIDQGATEWSGNIALSAGQKYPIKMEYYENGGGAGAQLRWSGPSNVKEIIPQSQLYPLPFCTGTGPQGVVTSATSGTLDFYAYEVENASEVNFAVWSDIIGQDDLIWYPGVNQGGGTWRASPDLANHRPGNPDWGGMSNHIWMVAPGGNDICGAANFLRSCNPAKTGSDRMEGCAYNGMNFDTFIYTPLSPGPIISSPKDSATPLPFDNWGGGENSGPVGTSGNSFSIRYKGEFNFRAGYYVFTIGSDDGSRLYFDDNRDGNPDSGYLVSYWSDRGYDTTDSLPPIAVSAGNHILVYEMYENAGGAAYSLWWNKVLSPPSNLQADNSSQCEQIRLTWTDNSDNEQGFHIWRDVSPGGSPPTLSYNSRTYYQIATVGANSTSYTDSPSAGASYYYVVTSYNASGDSSVSSSNAVGPVYNNPCQANLSPSVKVLYRVNGVDYTSQTIKNGDTLTFKVVISNPPPLANSSAYDVYIEDIMSDNLIYQAGTAKLDGNPLTEKIVGQTITWNWPARNLGDKAADMTNWILTFDAKVQSSSTQAIDFFQNTATIYYAASNGGLQNLSVVRTTGLIPVRTGAPKVPKIREVAP